MIRTPIRKNVHCGSVPTSRSPISKTPTISAPKIIPTIDPRPPNSDTPPITTAVIAWILPNCPVEAVGETEPNRPIITQPAMAQKNPASA